MDKLNTASYILTLRVGLKDSKKEAAATLILGTVNKQDFVADHGYYEDLSSKKISRVLSGLANTPDGIQQASLIDEVIQQTVENFKTEILPELNPHLKEDTLANMKRLVKSDGTIAEEKKDSLLQYLEQGQIAEFLSYTFLYALNKPNIQNNVEEVSISDLPFLTEVRYECPITHKDLVQEVRGKTRRRYKITQIFPADLDDDTVAAFDAAYPKPTDFNDPDNLIALYDEAASDYLFDPTIDEYKKLYELKRDLVKAHRARMNVNEEKLEDDIRTILDAIMNLEDAPATEPLSFDALHVADKIKGPFVLKKTVTDDAVTYYNYIEYVFSNSDVDFDLIASQIKTSSMMLENAGLTQREVVKELSDWIREKAGLGSDSSLASEVVVSFFIQNCEVFHP